VREGRVGGAGKGGLVGCGIDGGGIDGGLGLMGVNGGWGRTVQGGWDWD